MSNRHIDMAFEMPTNAIETFVLVTLADYADASGFCFPSYLGLIKKTKLSKSTLSKTLAILEGAGLFIKKAHSSIGQGRKVNTYQLSFDDSWFEKLEVGSHHVLIESTRVLLIEKINDLRKERKRAISSHLVQRKVLTSNSKSSLLEVEPSIKPPSKQPSIEDIATLREKIVDKKSTKTPLQLLSEFGIDKELAEDFIQHRKLKKAAISKTVLDGFLREANKAGISIKESIRECIERGWIGFKADWFLSSSKTQSAKRQDYGEYEPSAFSTELKTIHGERVFS